MATTRRGDRNGVPNGSSGQTKQIEDPKTDYSRWRLQDDQGRQTWHYLQTDEELKKWPQTTADKYHLGLDTVGVFPSLRNVGFTNSHFSVGST